MLNKYTRQIVAQRLADGDVRKKLKHMECDVSLNTKSIYSSNSDLYPNHQMPFVDKHIAYLMDHPKLNFDHYLANLRLMLKIRA